MQEICCSHQGHNPKTKKPSIRFGCPAMIRVDRGKNEDIWTVTKFEEEHNHPMKGKIGVTKNYPSHNHVDEGTRSIITDLVESGIKSTNMYGLLAGLHGGPSMVPFNRRVMDRIAFAIKRDECGDEVQKTLDFFEEMQSKSKNFFYRVQIDKACRETIDSFKWLFRTLKKRMNGKEPCAILTGDLWSIEIPASYILRRWTKNARDDIPTHLQGYRDDEDAAASRTYRHTLLHRTTLELTRLGNTDADMFKDAMVGVSQVIEGLRKKLASEEDNMSVRRGGQQSDKTNSRNCDVPDGMSNIVEEMDCDVPGIESCDEGVSRDEVLPQEPRRKRGRPKVTRMKTAGEQASVKNARGKRREVNVKKAAVSSVVGLCTKASQDSEGKKLPTLPRRCQSCGEKGHYSNRCGQESTYKRKNYN
ncbi:hypothetical protein ACP70R_046071 [Stipagrostis hirtigluma subsp. patula]